MTQLNDLSRILETEDGQVQMKYFLNQYHERLHSEHGLPRIKLSKALHTAAKTLGYKNWHQASALSDSITGNDAEPKEKDDAIWMVDFWEKPDYLISEYRSPKAIRGYRQALYYIAEQVAVKLSDVMQVSSFDFNDLADILRIGGHKGVEEYLGNASPSLFPECFYTNLSIQYFDDSRVSDDLKNQASDFFLHFLKGIHEGGFEDGSDLDSFFDQYPEAFIRELVDAYFEAGDSQENVEAGYYIEKLIVHG